MNSIFKKRTKPQASHIEETGAGPSNLSDSQTSNNLNDENKGSENGGLDLSQNMDTQSLWQLKSVVLLCVANTFTGFLFGWDTGTIGGITGSMTGYINRFAPVNSSGEHEFSTIVVGLIVSIFNLGCAIGAVFLSKIGDYRGRKYAITVSIVIYIIGLIIQMTSVCSSKWYQHMIGRFITGLCVGMTSVLTPMFISESAPIKIRGGMVCIYQLMITLGILFGYCCNYGCKNQYYDKDAEWLIPLGLGFIWAVLVLCGMSLMPESPYYLIAYRNDREAAVKSIATLNRLPADSPLVQNEVQNLVNQAEEYKRAVEMDGDNSSWHEFFTGEPKLGLRLLIGIYVMSIQQLSGANYFFYYGTSLFESVGLSDSFVTSIILGAVNCAPTFFSVYLVERFGRKSCLLVGSIGMGTCMLIYASVGGFGLYDSNGDAKYSSGVAMIVFCCFAIVGFATTWGPICYVLVSELYPIRTKNLSMSVATASNWIWNFLISLFTPFITSAIDYKFGYVFAGCLVSAIFVVIFFVPETKGLTSNEIDDLYRNYSFKKAMSFSTKKRDVESVDDETM